MSVPQRLRPDPPEDYRAARPYLLRRSPLTGFLAACGRVLALVVVDITGLSSASTSRWRSGARPRSQADPLEPALGRREPTGSRSWSCCSLLVFWRNRLYGPRELREGAGGSCPRWSWSRRSTLAFAIGTGQHFTTFGLYVVGAISVAA